MNSKQSIHVYNLRRSFSLLFSSLMFMCSCDTRQKEKNINLSFSCCFHFISFPSFHTSSYTYCLFLNSAVFGMPTSKYSHIDTKSLPSNIMDLRDEAFYDFIRQFSGKRVAELLAFQECNGVDSFLGCKDVTAVLHLKSDQINDLKNKMSITLSDGSVALLPGIESSISSLIKLLKKKREEINKQAQRLQSITSSVLSAPTTTSSVLPTTGVLIYQPSIHTSSPSDAPIPANSSNSPSLNFSATPNPLTYEISSRISATITNWLKDKQRELNLINISFQQGIDFHVELNQRRDGVIMRCKCGMKNAISQKQGVLVVRD